MDDNNNVENAAHENVNENDNNEENEPLKVFDIEKKIANYANIRATDLPTVQRLFPPAPSTIRR